MNPPPRSPGTSLPSHPILVVFVSLRPPAELCPVPSPGPIPGDPGARPCTCCSPPAPGLVSAAPGRPFGALPQRGPPERRTSRGREDADDGGKTGALRPRGSGGLQQAAGGGGGAGGWEPSGTLVAFETASSPATEMASQSQGIQQLLQAEKRAAEKVADARKSEPPLSCPRALKENSEAGDSGV